MNIDSPHDWLAKLPKIATAHWVQVTELWPFRKLNDFQLSKIPKPDVIDRSFKSSRHCVLAAQGARAALFPIARTFARLSPKIISPFTARWCALTLSTPTKPLIPI